MINGRYNQHGPFSCTHNGLILFKNGNENRNEDYFLSVPAGLIYLCECREKDCGCSPLRRTTIISIKYHRISFV